MSLAVMPNAIIGAAIVATAVQSMVIGNEFGGDA